MACGLQHLRMVYMPHSKVRNPRGIVFSGGNSKVPLAIPYSAEVRSSCTFIADMHSLIRSNAMQDLAERLMQPSAFLMVMATGYWLSDPAPLHNRTGL